ncbi:MULTISPECIES: hypothetical protein [Actinosynnema]|uniref:hypothetical protein n=1 Tax=Actinosynnema TaxID=40566 RepID=UPI0020A35CC7|nr:hypothetical protein [Actinosynnema pretiosum]
MGAPVRCHRVRRHGVRARRCWEGTRLTWAGKWTRPRSSRDEGVYRLERGLGTDSEARESGA